MRQGASQTKHGNVSGQKSYVLAFALNAFFQFFGLLCIVSFFDVSIGDMQLLQTGIVVVLILLLRYYLGREPACTLSGNGDASAVVDCKKMC